jgi:hypothetical protein
MQQNSFTYTVPSVILGLGYSAAKAVRSANIMYSVTAPQLTRGLSSFLAIATPHNPDLCLRFDRHDNSLDPVR